jgi:Flp pilus assembly pilin Flp
MRNQRLIDRVMPEREPGQSNVEYALILVVVSIASAAALTAVGGRVADTFLHAVTSAF